VKAEEESAAVHAYIAELKDLLVQNPDIDRTDKLSLRADITEYERCFGKIEASVKSLASAFEQNRRKFRNNEAFYSLVEATFIERPAKSADSLAKEFRLPRPTA